MNFSNTTDKHMEKRGISFIFMGVSGTGKTSIGQAVAKQLGLKMIDGDDLHPRTNILKMANGQSLNDQDRLPWLTRINDAIFSLEHKNENGIIACSSLKKSYRDHLRQGNKAVFFVFLQGSFQVILQRMQARQGHFMKQDMLKSQFATLELPDSQEANIIPINIEQTFEQVVWDCVQQIQQVIQGK